MHRTSLTDKRDNTGDLPLEDVANCTFCIITESSGDSEDIGCVLFRDTDGNFIEIHPDIEVWGECIEDYKCKPIDEVEVRVILR